MASKANLRRCIVCRQQLATVGMLRSHLMQQHSKLQVVRELFQSYVLINTPNALVKAKKRQGKKDDTNNNNLIELKSDQPKCEKNTQISPEVQSKKTKKSKKSSDTEARKISKPTKSLHEHTGEFYECRCMMPSAKMSSDTESCSDTTKTFYCNFCGNGYQTVVELTEHEKLHQIQCRICSQFLSVQSYRDHFQQHILRVYACHICGFECICKEVLTRHLDYHFEQQTLDDIVSMEQDYSVYPYSANHFSSGNYHSDMKNLLFFLTYPHDQQYGRNLSRKVACHVCFQQIAVFEYELHLKIAHALGN